MTLDNIFKSYQPVASYQHIKKEQPEIPQPQRQKIISDDSKQRLSEFNIFKENNPESEVVTSKEEKNWNKYSKLIKEQQQKDGIFACNFLQSKLGITAEQAAGIVGVMISESALNPQAYNKTEKEEGDYGAGICQWTHKDTKARIKKCLQKITNTDKGEIENYSLEEQLQAFCLDLQNHSKIFAKLKSAETVEEAADIMTRGIENGGMTGRLVSIEWFNEGYAKNHRNQSGTAYENAMMNTDPKFNIGRVINARGIYNLIKNA